MNAKELSAVVAVSMGGMQRTQAVATICLKDITLSCKFGSVLSQSSEWHSLLRAHFERYS